MTVRKNTGKTRLESSSGIGGRIITAVLLYGAALVSLYLVLAAPEKNTATGAIREVLLGTGGSLAILIPVFLGYVATLFLQRARDKGLPAWKSILYGALFPLTHALVQVFCTEDIIRNHMAIQTWANYLKKSYSYGGGGGFIGGILAWPAYRALGKVGGGFVLLLLIFLVLLLTGAMGALAGAVTRQVDRSMEKREERRADRELFEPEKKDRRHKEEETPWASGRQKNMDRGMILPDRTRVRRTPSVPSQPEKKSAAAPSERIETERKPRKRTPEREAALAGAPRHEEHRKRPAADRRPRSARPDIPEYLQEEHPKAEAAEKAPARKPRVQAAKRPQEKPDDRRDPTVVDVPAFDPGKVRQQKAEDGQLSFPDDLTIEPDHSEVISGDEAAAVKAAPVKMKRPKHVEEQPQEEYNYPPIDLLPQGDGFTGSSREADLKKAKLLEETLEEFSIKTKLTGIAHGPAVTRFELQPAPGVKVSRITSLTDDITLHLAAPSVRIEAPIPGKAAVGVEVPNDTRETVRLRDVLESPEARKSSSKIAVGLGKDNSGRYIVADIAKMPHVLIAGQTGAGKSVCINALIISILYRAAPDEVKLIMIDPKVVELSVYNDIPHLVCPVVTDCQKAASALDWAVAEMETRYHKFAERNVRDIRGYNKALEAGEEIMPQMVIIIDELADLMMAAPGEVEDSIQRLAQKARAAGIHLVIATQRPSVNVVTGVIKANIPSRIAFSVSSQIDSRTIIDHAGAEKLLGNGDMLFAPSGINKPMRVQGAWVSDEEVNAIVSYIKERSEVNYNNDMIEKLENAVRTDAEKEEVASEYDPRLPEAVEIVVEAGQASVSMLQRRMRVGYARAGRLIDEMERRGIVSAADGAKPRSVLINREELEAMFEDEDAS